MTGPAQTGNVLMPIFTRPAARWAVLLLIAAAVIGTAIRSYRNLDAELTTVALTRREAVARLMAATLTEKFGRLVDVAVSLSTRQRVHELVAENRWTEAIGYLRTVPRDLPAIERLFLTDVGGTLRADTPTVPEVNGVNFSHREWFQGVSRDWRPFVSPVYIRAAIPRLKVLAVAVPVRDTAGRVAGILVLQIRIERLLDWLHAVELGPEGFVCIIDSSGQVAFHSRQGKEEDIADAPATPALERLRRAGHGVDIVFDPVVGEESIVAYAALPEYGWSVVAQQPVRASLGLAARDEQLRQLVAGYGLILLLGATTLYLTSRVAVERQRTEGERRRLAERELAERALREKDRLMTIMGVMAKVGGWEFDPRTGKGAWTDEVARIHDMDPKAETSTDVGLAFYRGESRKLIEAAVKDAVEHGKPYDLELEMVTAKDNHKWVRTIGQPVVENGVVTKVWGSFQDITERKRVEEEIRRLNADLERKVAERTAELEAANRELEAFSYSVSHDLRAPLRSIDGFSQAVLEDYAAALDDRGRDYLQRLRSASQRMGELIDDMLQLSRVTRAGMRRETVDLSALAGSVAAELRDADPGNRVEVVIQPGLRAEGDAKLLRIALVNLMSNAWKFTGRQPSARIELGAQINEEEHAFFVRDNGVGFDMAYVGKLFGAFQRLHSQDEFPGTGIGLATVQRIINRHGGRVWAEAAVSKGATFYFSLPFNHHA
jgi:signal transduction histidine kinase